MSRSTFLARFGSENHIRELDPEISGSTSIRESVSKNPYTPTDIVDKYAHTHHEFLGHPNMSKDKYEEVMCGDLQHAAKLEAISSPHFNETHMAKVGLDPDPTRNPHPKNSLISRASKSNLSSNMLDHFIVPHLVKGLNSYDTEDLSKNPNLNSHHIDTIIQTPSKPPLWSKQPTDSHGPDPIAMQYLIAHPSFTKGNISKIAPDKVGSPWVKDALYKKFGE